MVEHTNLLPNQGLKNKLRLRRHVKDWLYITSDQIDNYAGISI